MASAQNHQSELLLQSYSVQRKMIRSPSTQRQTVMLMRIFISQFYTESSPSDLAW